MYFLQPTMIHWLLWQLGCGTSGYIAYRPQTRGRGWRQRGGNLAAAVALGTKDAAHKPAFQLLIYPATVMYPETPSYHANGDGYGLTAVAMHWFMDHYLPTREHGNDWRASPLKAPSMQVFPPLWF
jgi:acetyl esterase